MKQWKEYLKDLLTEITNVKNKDKIIINAQNVQFLSIFKARSKCGLTKVIIPQISSFTLYRGGYDCTATTSTATLIYSNH